MDVNIISIIASIAVICFNTATLPDIYRVIKNKSIKGVTLTTPLVMLVGATCELITNYSYGNFIFVFNDSLGIITQITVLVLRWKYLQH